MKTKLNSSNLVVLLALSILHSPFSVSAQSTAFTYQGRLTDGGSPANGSYDLTFSLFANSSGPPQVGNTVTNLATPIANGMFTVTLDFGANFPGADRFLEMGARASGPGPFITLSPRQKILSAPYAITANILNGTIGGSQLAPNSVDSSKILDGTIVNADLSSSAAIADAKLTTISAAGKVANTATTATSANTPSAIVARDASGNFSAGIVSATSFSGSGASLTAGTVGLSQLAGNSVDSSKIADGTIVNADVSASAAIADTKLATISTPGKVLDTALSANVALLNAAQTLTANKCFGPGAQLLADGGSEGAPGLAFCSEPDTGIFSPAFNTLAFSTGASERMRLTLNGRLGIGVINPGKELEVQHSGDVEIGLKSTDTNGQLWTIQSTGITGGTRDGTFQIIDRTLNSARLLAYTNGNMDINLVSPQNRLHVNGDIVLVNGSGTNTIQIEAQHGIPNDSVGEISLFRADGTSVAIKIDADHGSGESRIITDTLEITGGSDLSENFEILSASDAPEPGMIVSINPENPGQLLVSSKAYDPMVAGVMSGAGGVKPGMLMGQRGTAADGKHPVALSGRVYCLVDTAWGAIRPGDLITTSATPGHGRRTTDARNAQGAVIGKAMTGLTNGRGLVLVLVSLQ